MTREKDVESRLCILTEKAGGRAYKFTSPGCDGVPDRLVLLPGGRAFFVETKAPGKKPRLLQEKRGEELAGLGIPAYWIDSKEEAENLITTAMGGKLPAIWGKWSEIGKDWRWEET